MPFDAMFIIILIGILSLYVFYLISIYIKLENRRSLILSKFTEVNNLIDNKIEIINNEELLKNKNINEIRLNLLNTVNVNERIKYNKILDDLIEEVDQEDKKFKKIITDLKEVNDKINYSKEFYNESLYEYNTILNTKSGNILRKLFKYSEYNTF